MTTWARPRLWLWGAPVWLALLLIEPAMAVGNQQPIVYPVLVIVAVTAASAGAVLTRLRPPAHLPLAPELCILVLAILIAAASLTYGRDWLNLWLILAIVVGAVIRGSTGMVLIAAVTLAASLTVWQLDGTSDTVWAQALTVFLAGASAFVLVRLIDTIWELKCTREQLARQAVLEERERFSRDLHDLLGHTLSVVVVKAEAVRRLAPRDRAAAVQHAQDIEAIGRRALAEVREAVDGYRGTSLTDEIARGRAALAAAGIATEVLQSGPGLPAPVDEVLAWVAREGVTNVIRHSGATRCRMEVRSGEGKAWLELTDDGAGASEDVLARRGGLDGLRQRLALADGLLDATSTARGFRLVATVPATVPASVPAEAL